MPQRGLARSNQIELLDSRPAMFDHDPRPDFVCVCQRQHSGRVVTRSLFQTEAEIVANLEFEMDRLRF